jgi:hypothetical protein
MPGSFLYMPEGWWHIATPINEPTLHLTVGIDRLDGWELLRWAINQARHDATVRLPLPHRGESTARNDRLSAIRRVVESCLADGAIDRFLADERSRMGTRPAVQLPTAPDARGISNDTALLLSAGHCLAFSDTESGLICQLGDRRWRCDPRLVQSLRQLNHETPVTLADLMRRVPPSATASLTLLIGEFVSGGALVLREPTTAPAVGAGIATGAGGAAR